MQQSIDKSKDFKVSVGAVLRKLRATSGYESLNKFALEYDVDRGNLSKVERGEVGCSIMTAWRITEALGIRFSEFAKLLEDELGEDFRLMDE